MIVFWLPVISILIGNIESEYVHFEEPCASDSVNIEGVCKCDHSLCEIPPCESTLVQITNLTDIPSSCCPTYSCEDCAEEDQIEGMCPCLPGAIIRSGRKCECANKHYTLVNDTCECDVNKCELPDLCDERSVAVREFDDCCTKIKCIECPSDSYPTTYNASLEDICVCYPCAPFQCNETQLQVKIKGQNVAGKCCDVYTCETRCSVNGTLYSDGESWSSGDSQCNCQSGVSVCSPIIPSETSRPCLSPDTIHQHLDTWVEDSCTNCTCINGVRKCIAHMCDVHVSEVRPPFGGCPSLSTCKKVCEHGFRLNRQGCEICKCKTAAIQNKADKLDILLQDYNVTEEELVRLIRNRAQYEDMQNAKGSSTFATTSSTPAPSTTICISEHKNNRGDCTYSCILEYGIPGFVVGAIFAGILLFTFLKCSEKNRQKYKMHYNYKPVGKETLDKNLNISPVIKSKNFELKSYNEKKNVI
ncbi:hypothetical protein RI129_011439 [Pyrocoelia pectoralis]|uniref:Antistasin-like domain-containing protein n=1 Tax=Pyrocoelia pectoralis TaxID=417401 RepID=A0AAN7ZIS0_9COLE